MGYLKVFHEPGASEQRNKLKLREDHRNLLSLHQQVANFHGRELTSKPVAWKDVKFNFRLSFFLVVLMLLERFNFNLLRVKRKIRSLWK